MMKSGYRVLRTLPLIVGLCLASLAWGQEICDNGIDDDGNGLVDLNDTLACPCVLQPPPTNLISNGSFEDHDCCPQGASSGTDEIECAMGWFDYMSTASVDYYNTCGYFPATTPEPPSGEGVFGMGQLHSMGGDVSSYECIAQCLTEPLEAGETYQFGFHIYATRRTMSPFDDSLYPINYGPINWAVYGMPSCPSLPAYVYDQNGYIVPSVLCPTELGWVEMGHVTYHPSSSWSEVNFTFTTPFDVQAILFGPTCPIPDDYLATGNAGWPYFFFDDLSIFDAELLLTTTGHVCTDDLVLSAAPYDATINSYQWYLDGVAVVGQTGQVLNASSLGLGAGTYAIRMIRPDGSCALVEQEIVEEYPVPLVGAVPTTGCVPLVVQFNNQTDPALSGTLAWDLGDGTTINNNPSFNHTYTQPGTYDVRLTVTSPQGCTADSLFEGLITVYPKPVPAFQADTTFGCAGLPVTFTGTAQPPGNYTYAWSFGDGGISSGSPATHAYNNPGTFNVMLIATSEFGCSGEVTVPQLVQVLPAPAPAFIAEPGTGCIPLNVRFDNHTPGQDDMTAWWDLGNGSTSTSANPATTYTQPGTYTVTLTMTNQAGCSTTVTDSSAVTAYEPPVVSFSMDPTVGCAPLHVQFTNTTDPGMIGSCLWDFGDGQASNDCVTGHTYQQPGTYSVSLHVAATTGCEGDTTLFNIITVLPNPVAYFGFRPIPAEISNPEITFRDSSSIDVVAWDWTFPYGDPPTAQTPNATVIFPGDAPGVYPVQLIVTNEHGCTDTIVRNVPIIGELTVYVPNAFTPDADDINDTFFPVLRDADPNYYHFSIFDRWGAEIFSSSTIGEGWDGTVKGAEPKTDVYTWMLRVKSVFNAETRLYRGKVVLLR